MAWVERYISVAGGGAHDGTSEADAWTLAEAIAAPYAAGQRINVKAGTYANTTTDRTFAVAGTTTAPIWFRGYNTTIGDLDADFTTAKPAITFTTGRVIITGSHHYFSNFNISGAQVTNGQVRINTGTVNQLDRCRIECTSANANGRAISSTAVDTSITRCWLKSSSSAEVVNFSGTRSMIAGNALEGGLLGIALSGAASHQLFFNVFNNVGGDAITSSATGQFIIVGNTIYSPGGDGIELTALPAGGLIANNIFSECGGWGINNSSGANTNLIKRLHNLFHSNTSGNETGFGDSPSFTEKTDGSSPFTNAAGSDLSLLITSNAKGSGLPGLFENQSYTSFLDIGAVQRQEPSASGIGRLVGGGLVN